MIVTLADLPYALLVNASDDEAQAFSVVVPDLHGCRASGDTFEEAIENAREAIERYRRNPFDQGHPASPAGTLH